MELNNQEQYANEIFLKLKSRSWLFYAFIEIGSRFVFLSSFAKKRVDNLIYGISQISIKLG